MPSWNSQKVNGEVAFDRPAFEAELSKHEYARITVEAWSEAKERSLQQTRWWKGVYLPQLATYTNYQPFEMEAVVKMQVMPDIFIPRAVFYKGVYYPPILKSITELNRKQMNELIEGAVTWAHNQNFRDITLPDSTMRKA